MDWRIYFDSSDEAMDDHGWNVVQHGGAIAARFRTSLEALDYLAQEVTIALLEERDIYPGGEE